MSIRRKILLYFSATIISLLGMTLFFIYTLFYEYREEEFQQKQKQKITSTIKFLTEIRQADESIIQAMDRISINEFYDEKLLIFDHSKTLIYSSIDDLQIPQEEVNNILKVLTIVNPWLETKDDLYDVVGVYVKYNNNTYYGINKAFDESGYSKLDFLRYVLLITFLGISLVVMLIAYYLSRIIAEPIVDITEKITNYNFDTLYIPIEVKRSENEIVVLAEQFNKLMKRMKEAVSFQKHAINHISHELKTPIAVLVSNFERMENEMDLEVLKSQINRQKEDTKNLSEIINLLLELSKTDAGQSIPKTKIRVDELIFDTMDELLQLYPDFEFSVDYVGPTDNESLLTIQGSARLLKAAFMNLMLNSIHYSSNKEGSIRIITDEKQLQVDFINEGPVITTDEQKFLFQHFFRGENSKGKSGFGLGLVFIYKIISQHQGLISYHTDHKNLNIFTVIFPFQSD
ncbi:HAMP domain-containing sensor histidine kinase [Xanthomarina sp.]|uniref:HAMP domain-containing sensor histidine kinase n=1 Tax=Xanthomarina sp. TaxID=1931211 RepID=UPI002CF81453|nr:HAMP domain-containing sensor histidine kinase [Xanthomarina sp.]HLV40516.1 HAMP domain-containing sensor histidine kinase [Xanthomarina sp.]